MLKKLIFKKLKKKNPLLEIDPKKREKALNKYSETQIYSTLKFLMKKKQHLRSLYVFVNYGYYFPRIKREYKNAFGRMIEIQKKNLNISFNNHINEKKMDNDQIQKYTMELFDSIRFPYIFFIVFIIYTINELKYYLSDTKNPKKDILESIINIIIEKVDLQLDNERIDIVNFSDINERINDVKGIDNVRSEVEEIIQFLKMPHIYKDAGAKLVKGFLLVGPPGTGKTMLAKALAAESKTNFIYLSASEIESKYVGKSAKKIKSLFKTARKKQPCIIFIDEIDSLLHSGRRKGSYSTSEDRSIINAFLTEMDGFVQNENIFVLGATNDINNLDQAALRPGRFDKILHIPKPDKKGRSEIFDLYLKKVNIKLSDELTSDYLSLITPGFTGADIHNIVNLALIDAVDKNSNELLKIHFQDAIDRIILGIKYDKKKPKKLRFLLQRAIHEAGHTLICYKNDMCRNSLHKSTISSRGASEGTTSYIINHEDMDDTKEEMSVLIDVSVAGILAEEIYFGDNKISTGCGKDINKAYSYASNMVKKFAMSPNDQYMVIKDENFEHKISGETRNLIDTASSSIINTASERVRKQLNDSMADLLKLSRYLLEYEELDKDDITCIMEGRDIDNKKNKLRQVNMDNIKL